MIFLHAHATAIAQQLCIDLPSRPNLTPTPSQRITSNPTNMAKHPRTSARPISYPPKVPYARRTFQPPNPKSNKEAPPKFPTADTPTPPKSTPPPTPISQVRHTTDRSASLSPGGGPTPKNPTPLHESPILFRQRLTRISGLRSVNLYHERTPPQAIEHTPPPQTQFLARSRPGCGPSQPSHATRRHFVAR